VTDVRSHAGQPRLNGFFQGVTVLWTGVFLTLAVSLGTLLATASHVPADRPTRT
jgi:hypothetical protein